MQRKTEKGQKIMSIDLTSNLYNSLSNDALNKLQKAMYRCVDLIEAFFPIPDEPGTHVKLYPDQRDAIDTIQYGYPISKFRFKEFSKFERPEGGILMSRRQVGKSVLCGYSSAGFNIIGYGFPDFKIPCFCGIVSASEDESFELIDKTRFALEESDFNDFIVGRPKKDKVSLKNKSWSRAYPCSDKAIRGKKHHYLFIDEGRWMEESVLFEAALPTVEHGVSWFAITTPQGTKGRLTELYIKAIGERPLVCKDCLKVYSQRDFPKADFPIKQEIWLMPSLPKCTNCGGNNYEYGYGYIATPYINPWKCPIIDKDKLKRRLDYYSWSAWARQEWLGELVDEASMIILKEWIERSTNENLRNVLRRREGLFYVLGLDFGRLHDATCFTIIHRDPNTNRIVLDYMKTISGEFDIETDWDGIHAQAKQIISYWKPSIAVMDSTSMGYREVESIQKEISEWSPGTQLYHTQKNWWKLPPERRRLGFWFDRVNKPQLIGNMRALFSTNPPALEIPSVSELEIKEFVTELLRFECIVQDSGYIEYGTQDYHDDRVISYALALWGISERRRTIFAKARGIKTDPFKKPKSETKIYGNYVTSSKPKIVNIERFL